MGFPLKRDCFVSSVTVLALKTLGLDSLEWDPRILRDALASKFDSNGLPQRVFDKLNCGYTLVGTDAYSSTIEGFLTANAVMADKVFDATEVPFNDLKTIAWGVWEYINLVGDIKNGEPTETFSSDIILYIQEVAEANGIRKYPAWLSFAEPSLKGLPDMGTDGAELEMYLNRQQDNVNMLNIYVSERQNKLLEELNSLKKQGLIANEN